jgi:hypothetical protein
MNHLRKHWAFYAVLILGPTLCLTLGTQGRLPAFTLLTGWLLGRHFGNPT